MFRKITDRLDRIATALEAAIATIGVGLESLQTPERLGALEGEIERVKGEARALVTEAEARFNAARASEERTRHQVKRLERLQELEEGDDESDFDFEEWERIVQERNAQGGPGGGVPPVRETVDLSGEAGEALAERWKWNGQV